MSAPLRVALVGYGTMGREVGTVLRERGHEGVPVLKGSPFPPGCPVGIDFTRGEDVPDNVRSALNAGARYVVGTTGWSDKREEVERFVRASRGGLLHSANFSIGVNLFYRIVRASAALMARFPEYDPYILERHHRRKVDAPSGTARVLGGILESSEGRRRRGLHAFQGALPEDAFHVAALRAGGIVGDHTVGFDAGGDEILLEHRARSRRGFAVGAALAAEWMVGRVGVYSFDAVLDDLQSAPA